MFPLFLSCCPPSLVRQGHFLNLECIGLTEPQGPFSLYLPGAGVIGTHLPFFGGGMKFWVIKFRSSCLCGVCFTN